MADITTILSTDRVSDSRTVINANFTALNNAILAIPILGDGDKGDITVSGSGSTWTIDTGLAATKIADGSVSNAEFQYLGGVTSDIQTQLNAKQASITFGTGILTALGINVGSAGAPVLFNGALGTPSSGVATNLTGTASGLTAGNVTTNANLTGHITSTGNAAVLGSFTLAQLNTAVSDANIARTDAGNTLVGTQLLSEGASIGLDPAASADGTYSGLTITATSGYSQAFGDLVYLDPTDSRWEAVDANAASGADGDARGILGMVVVAGTDGNACTILLNGVIRADANFPTFTVNAPIYASETAGDVTNTQPTTTDVVIRTLGFGLDGNTMYFNPSSTYITHT